MTEEKTRSVLAGIEKDRQLIVSAREKGGLSTLSAYVRLSGPGWLQSAITLGGGSLAGSLYLGVLGGFAMMWLQPLAMILGVIMLSAISYVTLSTGERPFQAINKHVNPVLGWGWAIATLMANLVWALPQFSLGSASVMQNLLPGVFTGETMGGNVGTAIACAAILAVCVVIVWFYDSGRKGIILFEMLLKVMVGIIVLCFFGVVVKMTLSPEGIAWGAIIKGFIPNPAMFTQPAETFAASISQVAPEFQKYWSDLIVSQQRDVMITVTATAVGINMTFLLPYSMLKRGWNKDFRGLAIFDLSTGLFIPFILATGCVVIASATQFHATPEPGFLGEKDAKGALVVPAKNLVGGFEGLVKSRIQAGLGAEAFAKLTPEEVAEKVKTLPDADKRMAAMLVKRDAFNLADSLAPLTGKKFAQYIFGVGVVGMAVSSIIILMLINGFVVCEMLGKESGGWLHRLGCMMPAIGVLGPFIFAGKAKFWLAVPTSVFGMVLIPIAYCTFLLLINQKNLLGSEIPKGGRRAIWNVLMLIAIALTGFGSFWAVWSNAHWWGMGGVAAFIGLAIVVHFIRRGKEPEDTAS